jgi:hypothetical protein
MSQPTRLRPLFLATVMVGAAFTACYTGPSIDQAYFAGDGADGSASGKTDGGDGGFTIAASGCTPDIATIQKTVFVPRCNTAGCHNKADQAASLDLESPAPDTQLIDVAAQQCGGQIRVRPGDPDHSYLIDKLAAAQPACGIRMPNGASGLAADDVLCIRTWVASLPGNGADGGGTVDSGTDAGPACLPGLTPCGSSCVDTTSDPKNCSKCGNVCAVACQTSACVTTCTAPTKNCNNACVDITSSSTNCGDCNIMCTGGKVCVASSCSCGSNVTLTTLQTQILTPSCAVTGCHTGVMPKAGLLLTAGNSYKDLVNKLGTTCSPSKTLVVPSNVDASYLMNKLTGVGMCAGTIMPKAGGALPPAQVDMVRSWICNGAMNN